MQSCGGAIMCLCSGTYMATVVIMITVTFTQSKHGTAAASVRIDNRFVFKPQAEKLLKFEA